MRPNRKIIPKAGEQCVGKVARSSNPVRFCFQKNVYCEGSLAAPRSPPTLSVAMRMAHLDLDILETWKSEYLKRHHGSIDSEQAMVTVGGVTWSRHNLRS